MRLRVRRSALLSMVVVVAACLVTGAGQAVAAPAPGVSAPVGGVNDLSCGPGPAHPNPVVLLHGLGATAYEDLNVLQGWLAARGYCTFASTYGAYPQFPLVGGLRDVRDSAAQIAGYIRRVHDATGAAKVDLVGHSEGGFQALYVPKTQDIAGLVGSAVAIAPPTHGTTFAGLITAANRLGVRNGVDGALRTVGCVACTQLTTGGAGVAELDDGSITRPGIDYTIVTSHYDELVTPPETSFVREPGVVSQYVQDFCPADLVGHIGEAYDPNVWNLVANGLEHTPTRRFPCTVGSPG